MIDYLVNLAKYQLWANNIFRKSLKSIDFDNFSLKTQYGTLRSDIAHIFGATELWFSRIDGYSPKTIDTGESYHDWESLANKWESVDKKFLKFIEKLTQDDLKREIAYSSLEGKKLKTTLDNILLQQLIHHQSYHRGQIATFLRQNKLPPVDATD